MWTSECLRVELHDLQKVCSHMLSWVGADPSGPEDALLDALSAAAAAGGSSSAGICDQRLLLQVYVRILKLLRLLLRALQDLPPRRASPSPRCVSVDCHLNAAQLAALLWARVRQLREAALAEMTREIRLAGAAATCTVRNQHPRFTQTEESCLARCESCVMAESLVKSLVDSFIRHLESPAVAQHRTRVVAGLSSLSQWGAMQALTVALRADVASLVASKMTAVKDAKLCKEFASESERTAERLRQLAEQSEAESKRAKEATELAEQEAKRAREESAQVKREAECKLADAEQLSRREVASLQEALSSTRRKEAELREQLQEFQRRCNETEARLFRTEQNLESYEKRRQDAEATEGDLRKQLEESQERHALLLRYPDLHGPLQPPANEADDPVQDMECQVRANDERIVLLTTQNERLRATISKMHLLAAAGRPPTRSHSRPTSATQIGSTSGQSSNQSLAALVSSKFHDQK